MNIKTISMSCDLSCILKKNLSKDMYDDCRRYLLIDTVLDIKDDIRAKYSRMHMINLHTGIETHAAFIEEFIKDLDYEACC